MQVTEENQTRRPWLAAWNPFRDPPGERERRERPTHWLHPSRHRWRRRLPRRGVAAVGPPAASSLPARRGALSALESRRPRSTARRLPPSDLRPHGSSYKQTLRHTYSPFPKCHSLSHSLREALCVPIPIRPYYLVCQKEIQDVPKNRVWKRQYAKNARMLYYIRSRFAVCEPAGFFGSSAPR